MSYNSKYFDRKPGSLENAVLEALGGQINEASMDVNLDDDKRLIQNIEKMKVKVKILSRATSGRGRVDVRLTGSKNNINKVVDGNQTSMRTDNDFAFNESTEVVEAKDMDKVNPDAVKKKFKDRKDKDIDNDGDVDSSDEYLHKRRKAVSKAIKSEEVELDESLLPLFFALYGVGAMVVLPGLIVYDMMLRNKGSNLDDKVSKVVGNMVSKFKKDKNYKPTSAEIDAAKKLEKEAKSKEPNIFKKAMEKLKSIKSKSEEVELDEGKMKDLAMKIADVYKKMKADRQMKGFADKFRADVKKSLDIRKSLEKVLPDYVGGQQITKLMEIDLAKRLAVLKRAQGRTDAAGAAATKADKRDANVKKGMMPKAGSAADKADTKYRASKARQDRLAKNVATAQDREAEKKYQDQKRKAQRSEATELGTPERTKHTLDVTPGQSMEDWNKAVGVMQEKNDTMRETLAKMWSVEEGRNHNPFGEAVKYPHMMYDPKSGKEVEAKSPEDHAKYSKMGYTHTPPKKEQKTMTGQPTTKVTVDPDMKEKVRTETAIGKKNIA